MNFLEICKRIAKRSGMSDIGPTTVVGQVGDFDLVVDWAAQAWVDIQNERKWDFLRKRLKFDTEVGKGVYTLQEMGATDLAATVPDTGRLYRAAAGLVDEQFMYEWGFLDWENTYDYASRPRGRPMVHATRPSDRALCLGSVPDDVYTFTAWYRSTPILLKADSDTPAIDEDLHMIVVHKALMDYANFDAAAEVKVAAIEGYNRLVAAMENRYLPGVGIS